MSRLRRRNRRIIPARAGFTAARRRVRSWAGDHPRSRGVYRDGETRQHRNGGSSPLARGLQRTHVNNVVMDGIIPARAGFTCWTPGNSNRNWDHPRSRGVYLITSFALRSIDGSSPLARGLLFLVRHILHKIGIIPARAGFTTILRTSSGRAGDHPRSRGVYRRALRSDVCSLGSSPLARGLHVHDAEHCHALRIIPARAGFTVAFKSHADRMKDHPRSRGVYVFTWGL